MPRCPSEKRLQQLQAGFRQNGSCTHRRWSAQHANDGRKDLSDDEGGKIGRCVSSQMRYAEFKAPKGLIKVELETRGNIISSISFSGDFFMYPEECLQELEMTLVGVKASRESVARAIQNFYRLRGIQTPMLEPRHWVEAVMRAVEEQR